MPIAFPILPDLGAYPTSGTDAQRATWLQIADLHARKAAVLASEALEAANRAVAEASSAALAEQKRAYEFMTEESERQAQQAAALVSALTALTASMGGVSAGGSEDVSVDGVVKIIAAVKAA